jgi:hypothetical protein
LRSIHYPPAQSVAGANGATASSAAPIARYRPGFAPQRDAPLVDRQPVEAGPFSEAKASVVERAFLLEHLGIVFEGRAAVKCRRSPGGPGWIACGALSVEEAVAGGRGAGSARRCFSRFGDRQA